MSANLFDLTGKVAVVTGANRGLGRAIALGVAGHGADVAALGRDVEKVDAVAQQIRALGRRSLAVQCDISDEAQVESAVARVMEHFGQIDVLVNNAGKTKRIATFDYTRPDWEELINTNLVGTYLMSRAVGKVMIERRRGSIISVSSLAGGFLGLGRGNCIYSATKAGIVALTRELAAEWAQYGIRVNCLAPCWFETDMIRPLMDNRQILERILQTIPLGRLGKPEDMVGPVVFLASDASAMITAHQIPVDGGCVGILSLTNQPVIS